MILGGFQALTFLDYPGRMAAMVFTQGCNLRCGYCHNGRLIGLRANDDAPQPTASQVLELLATRRRLLEGVVVSGGEPTLQPGLSAFLRQIKELELRVKLDTNGTNPSVLDHLLREELVDYVAMDVKHDLHRYAEVTGVAVPPAVLQASRDLLRASGVDHEFRTTILPRFHDEMAVERIARFCAGAPRYVLQPFRPADAWNSAFRAEVAASREQLLRLKQVAQRHIANVAVAGEDWGIRAGDGGPGMGCRNSGPPRCIVRLRPLSA
ncbi:MAG: anaerobic ribonucleoside-triphosphate reductase activating protein [Patescibacteria group bacterium]|nr:anaerobic ribonucleoside-triphosphate reductase activating protein [Patescibacteria group bacterium]